MVGDRVEIQVIDETEHKGNMEEILPRTSELIRPAVANVDQAMVIFAAAKPKPNLSLLDRISGENGGQEEALNRVVLRELLGSLKKEERELIVRRYFYDQTQIKIAEVMGISQVQVSRMEKRILKKMREGFE